MSFSLRVDNEIEKTKTGWDGKEKICIQKFGSEIVGSQRRNLVLEISCERTEVEETDSVSCPVAGFKISGIDHDGFTVTRDNLKSSVRWTWVQNPSFTRNGSLNQQYHVTHSSKSIP